MRLPPQILSGSGMQSTANAVSCRLLPGRGRRIGSFHRRIDRCRPGLEGGDHATHRLVEQYADDRLQETRAKFKLDKEVDFTAIAHRNKDPVIVQIPERSFFIRDINAEVGPVEFDTAGETLADALEADHEVGDQ